MRATLEFDLPAEEYEHECAIHAVDLASTITCIDEYLRQRIKHGETSAGAELDEVRRQLRELAPPGVFS